MTQPGSGQEEEEFRRALRQAKARGTGAVLLPGLAAGPAALFALIMVFSYYPWEYRQIPVALLFGAPLAAGVLAFVGLRKLLA